MNSVTACCWRYLRMVAPSPDDIRPDAISGPDPRGQISKACCAAIGRHGAATAICAHGPVTRMPRRWRHRWPRAFPTFWPRQRISSASCNSACDDADTRSARRPRRHPARRVTCAFAARCAGLRVRIARPRQRTARTRTSIWRWSGIGRSGWTSSAKSPRHCRSPIFPTRSTSSTWRSWIRPSGRGSPRTA